MESGAGGLELELGSLVRSRRYGILVAEFISPQKCTLLVL